MNVVIILLSVSLAANAGLAWLLSVCCWRLAEQEKRIKRLQEANLLLIDRAQVTDKSLRLAQERLFAMRHPALSNGGSAHPSGALGRGSQDGKSDWYLRGTGSHMNGN
jgi:hypothetical protein